VKVELQQSAFHREQTCYSAGVADSSRAQASASRELISDPSDLRPDTPWTDTKWAWISEEELVSHSATPRLCVATLLPFKDAEPDWAGFARCIRWMQEAAAHYQVEIVFVLNADTGYIFDLSPELYSEVLRRFRAEFPTQKFIAGVTARGAEDDSAFRADRYRPLLDLAQQHDNCEVMIMTSRLLNALDPERRRDAYFEIADFITRPALVHALEPAFVPWATPYEPWLLWQLAQHPKFVGGKISTLDEPHFLYWAAMCRDLGLDFTPHSGDDFGICTAIKLGLPLLIGAGASAAPLICAALDMWRENGVKAKAFPTAAGRFDTRVYKLFEALQSFEDTIFRLDARGSAAAYKHSTAHALHLLGLLDSPEAHPKCRDLRDDRESNRIAEALIRPARGRLGIPAFQAKAP
jgi:dihydrodipicolinate synthase/N-acetylneuraminate lyase